MKCPKCQCELIENAKFCQNCGISIEVEKDAKNIEQLEANNSDNSKFLGTILGLLIVGFVAYGCITHAIHYGDTYRGALQDIQNEQWSSAKSKLEELGNYKDCEILLPNVNYNYYLQTANENFNNKNYSGALSNYEKAKLYKNTDETVTVKIQKTKDLLAKQEAEQRKAQEIARKKAEQEKKRAEAKRIQARNRELAELQNIVDRAFVNVSIQDFGGEIGGVYEFYTYPQSWFSLSYAEKQNIVLACRKYIELKEGVSEHKAHIGVRVKSVYDGSELATPLSIK